MNFPTPTLFFFFCACEPFSLTVLITCQRELLLFIQWLRRWGWAKKIPRPDQTRADQQRHTPTQSHHRRTEGLYWKYHPLAHPCRKRRITQEHTPSVKIPWPHTPHIQTLHSHSFIRRIMHWSPSIKGDCTASAKRVVIGWYHLQSCFGFPHTSSLPTKPQFAQLTLEGTVWL